MNRRARESKRDHAAAPSAIIMLPSAQRAKDLIDIVSFSLPGDGKTLHRLDHGLEPWPRIRVRRREVGDLEAQLGEVDVHARLDLLRELAGRIVLERGGPRPSEAHAVV